MAVAAGKVSDVGEIAAALARWQVPGVETLPEDLERFPADLSDPFE